MYINNQFTQTYFDVLDFQLGPPLSSQEIDQSRKSLREKIHLFDIHGTSEERKKVLKMLNKIAAIRPGKNILENIFSSNKTVVVQVSKGLLTKCRVNKIRINLSMDHYCNALTRTEEIIMLKQKKWIILLHELGHWEHNLSEKWDYGSPQLHDDFKCIEEEKTIAGIDPNKEEDKEEVSIDCENGAMLAAGMDAVRLDHQGVSIVKGQVLGPLEWVQLRSCLPNMQKSIDEMPELLNKTYPYKGRQMLLLNIALKKRRWEHANCMFLHPAINVNNFDETGSLLEWALKAKQFNLAWMIINHPTFNPSARDAKGCIPLMITLQEAKNGLFEEKECRQILHHLLEHTDMQQIDWKAIFELICCKPPMLKWMISKESHHLTLEHAKLLWAMPQSFSVYILIISTFPNLLSDEQAQEWIRDWLQNDWLLDSPIIKGIRLYVERKGKFPDSAPSEDIQKCLEEKIVSSKLRTFIEDEWKSD